MEKNSAKEEEGEEQEKLEKRKIKKLSITYKMWAEGGKIKGKDQK